MIACFNLNRPIKCVYQNKKLKTFPLSGARKCLKHALSSGALSCCTIDSRRSECGFCRTADTGQDFDRRNAPYTSQQATHGGFVNRVIRAAFAKQKMEVEFVYFPGKRALEEAAMGNFQALFLVFSIRNVRLIFTTATSSRSIGVICFISKTNRFPDWQSLRI